MYICIMSSRPRRMPAARRPRHPGAPAARQGTTGRGNPVRIHMCVYIYIYIYTYMFMVYTYIYIYICI